MPPEMTPERWQRIGDLFTAALAEPAADRASWLERIEASDDERREVRAMLAAHEASDDDAFLESPAVPPVADGPAPPDPALVAGATFGSYRLVGELGRGGMGVVFEAEDLRLHRRVALKFVPLAGVDAPGADRLRREARAAAALVHPNIATIHALEEFDGRTAIVSELVEGETLRARLARGPLPAGEVLDIALALASALAAAHGRGIVHRDLKPENVLRLPDGRVKVLDFGLARLEGDSRSLASVSHVTIAGVAAGTPGYMAPEQLLGQAVDGRTDQFALGVLVVELATGVNPFEASSLPETIARLLAVDGLPDRVPATMLPAGLAAIAARCLRHRPVDRFESTPALVEAIQAARIGHPVSLAPAAPPAMASAAMAAGPALDPSTGRRPALWWWRFHQAAAAAIDWGMLAPAWLVHRELPRGLAWFLACLAATIVAANVRLHLRFSAAVLPAELPAQRARTRGWVALADWTLIVLWAWAGVELVDVSREWAVVFVAFAVGAALAVALIEPATTRAAFTERPR